MACCSSCQDTLPEVISNVTANVFLVSEKSLFLRSCVFGSSDSYVQVSSIFASSLLPRATTVEWPGPNLKNEFDAAGDAMVLDVYKDSNDREHHVPITINSIIRTRMDGLHLNAVGLVIKILEEEDGVLIRSKEIVDDVTCPFDNLIIPKGCDIKVGTVVVFEALSKTDTRVHDDVRYDYKCVSARVCPPSVTDANISIITGVFGKVVLDSFGFGVQFVNGTLPREVSQLRMPILEGAGDSLAPLNILVGQYVSCFVCSQKPFDPSNTEYEVIRMDLPTDFDWAVPYQDRQSLSAFEGNASYGTHTRRMTIKQTNACRLFNEDMENLLRDAFLFFVDRSKPIQFQKVIAKVPRFTKAMAGQLQLSGPEQAGDLGEGTSGLNGK